MAVHGQTELDDGMTTEADGSGPDDGQEVGYVNVHSVGPWTATVETA